MRLREVKSCAQSHTAGKWQSWHLIPAGQAPGSLLLAAVLGSLAGGAPLLANCTGEETDTQRVPSQQEAAQREGVEP